jgi:hypothetical protein
MKSQDQDRIDPASRQQTEPVKLFGCDRVAWIDALVRLKIVSPGEQRILCLNGRAEQNRSLNTSVTIVVAGLADRNEQALSPVKPQFRSVTCLQNQKSILSTLRGENIHGIGCN